MSQPAIIAQLNSHFVPVKINADNLPATAKKYNVTALPTIVIATPQGQMLDSMRGWIGPSELVARLDRNVAASRQSNAVYAQVPGAGTTPATSPSTPPSNPTPTTNIAGPALGAGAPTSPSSPPAGGESGLTDDRYADFFRRTEGASPAPETQPDATPQATAATPPAINPVNPIPQPALTPSNPPVAAQAYPPSHAIAAAAPPMNPNPGPAVSNPSPAYGSQSPPPAMNQPANPPAQPAAPPASQAAATPPTINPPLGLDGYCPVALCEKQQWVMGDQRWGAIHRGRTYLFSGPEEQRRFFTDPDRYSPVISGNDIVLATEQGQAVPGMREHGVYFDNRVYLFSNETNLEKFARNPGPYATQAMGSIQPGTNGVQSR